MFFAEEDVEGFEDYGFEAGGEAGELFVGF